MTYSVGFSDQDAVAVELKQVREREHRRAEARTARVKRYTKLLSSLSPAELEWFQADHADGASVVSVGLDSQGNPITIQGALNEALNAVIAEKRG